MSPGDMSRALRRIEQALDELYPFESVPGMAAVLRQLEATRVLLTSKLYGRRW